MFSGVVCYSVGHLSQNCNDDDEKFAPAVQLQCSVNVWQLGTSEGVKA